MSHSLNEITEASVKGGFLLFTGKALSTLILALGSILVARLLGPEDYGLYSLSLVVPSLLIGIVDLGVNTAMSRYLVKLKTEGKIALASRLLRSGLFFKVLTGLLLSVVCFALSDFFATYVLNRPAMSQLVKLSSSLILFRVIYEAANSAFIGLERMNSNALVMSLQSISKTILSLLFIMLGFSTRGALLGHVSSFFLASLLGSFILSGSISQLHDDSSHAELFNDLKNMLSYGFPLYLSTLLTILLNQYSKIVLAYFVSNSEIGNYNISTNLYSIVNVLVFPLTALFPAFSKLQSSSSELKTLFELSVKYTSMLIVPISVLVAFTSGEIVHTFYGNKYDLAPSFLSLYMVSFFYSGLGSMVFIHLFNGLGETKIIFKSNILGGSLLVPLAALLTMTYGVSGLIVALLISNLISLVYMLFISAKKLNLRIDLKSSLKIYLSSILSAVPIMVYLQASSFDSPFNLMLCVLIFFCTFITVAPIIKTVTKEDLAYIGYILENMGSIKRFVDPIFRYEEQLLKLRKRFGKNHKTLCD